MSISGLVLHTRPERSAAVRGQLSETAGVEVHAETDDGRLVVTVDLPDDGAAIETITQIGEIEGVLSTALIYNHFEDDPELKEQADEAVEA